jgi:DNA-binding transcriptional LysR family regulator
LRGTLRVTAPIDYGCSVVAPVLVEMRKRHPSLRAELRATDHLLDLVGEGIDVAVRFGEPADSSMRAMRVSTFEEWLVAAPDFIGKRPPSTPEDVRRLPFVALSVLPHPQSWKFDGPGKSGSVMIQFEAAMTTNTAHAVRSAVIAGGGLGVLPNVIAAEDVGAGAWFACYRSGSCPWAASMQSFRGLGISLRRLRRSLRRSRPTHGAR